MTDVKRFDDDDDGDMKTIDADGKIVGSSDEDSDVDDTPDETIEMPNGMPDIWLVKLPRSLMERWAKVPRGGVELAKMRVYNVPPGQNYHRIAVSLPENPEYDTTGESQNFTFNVPTANPDNQYVFADKPKPTIEEQAGPSKARLSKLLGRVAHDGSFQPVLDSTYEEKVRLRSRKANAKTRATIRIDDKLAGGGKLAGGMALSDPNALKQGQANLKMLASGAGQDRTAIAFGKKANTKNNERFARIAKNELIDKLMELFKRRPDWSMKELREMTEQPTDYLREILQMIAVLRRSGEKTNRWHLNPTQKAALDAEMGISGEEYVAESSGSNVKMEGVKTEISGEVDGMDVDDDDDDEEEDEDDEEDFEEV